MPTGFVDEDDFFRLDLPGVDNAGDVPMGGGGGGKTSISQCLLRGSALLDRPLLLW